MLLFVVFDLTTPVVFARQFHWFWKLCGNQANEFSLMSKIRYDIYDSRLASISYSQCSMDTV